MSTKDRIIISDDPKGVFREGIINGTPKPGTVMQIKNAVEPISGAYQFEVYNRDADGNRPKGPLWVLLEDYGNGRTIDDAYVDGDRCRCYCPAPGEVLNMLIANIAGTGDTFAIGDILMVDDGTGKLIAEGGGPESHPFMMGETVGTALTADDHKECFYAGH